MTERPARAAALVTGASGGIGEAIAAQLAALGLDIVVVARHEDRLRGVAGRLRAQYGVRAEVVIADLTRPEAVAQLMQAVAGMGLQIDVLVNNAGFGAYGEFSALPLQRQLDLVQVNIAALTALTHHALPGMLRRGRGRVLNVSSIAGFLPGPLSAVYFASKAYVISFSEGLNEELRGSGVSVTALCPGPVDTRFFEEAGMQASQNNVAGGRARGMLLPAERVAREGVRGLLTGEGLVVPGAVNRLMTWLPRLLPRQRLARIMRQVQARR